MTQTDQQDLSILQKDHEIMCKIGEGQYSSVYKIYNNQYQRHFAAKVIKIPEENKKDVIDHVNNEVDILNSINHQNIIKIYKYFQEGSTYFIIFDDCSGGRLETLISISRFIAQPHLQFYAYKILQAVNCCHSHNFSHCEINPTNILIDGHDQPKLIHFRNAVSPKNKHVCNISNSDIHYLAPEALLPEFYDAEKADIWSLGITFYYMATGHFPWHAKSPADLLQKIKNNPIVFPENVPQDFQCSILNMLQNRPSQRPSTEELLQDKFFMEATKIRIQPDNRSKRLSYVSGQMCKSMLQPTRLQNEPTRLRKRNSLVSKTNRVLLND